jgi:hypothetical protein
MGFATLRVAIACSFRSGACRQDFHFVIPASGILRPVAL